MCSVCTKKKNGGAAPATANGPANPGYGRGRGRGGPAGKKHESFDVSSPGGAGGGLMVPQGQARRRSFGDIASMAALQQVGDDEGFLFTIKILGSSILGNSIQAA